MRVDRAVTLSRLHPLRKWRSAETPRIPILMYHSIAKGAITRGHPYYQVTTAPQVFARQVQGLRADGYSVIGLPEAITRLYSEAAFGSGKYVVITFDDGFENVYTEAFPILSEYGATATVFLPTGFIGDTAQSFAGTRCLTWSMVAELSKAGITFGSHTVTHRPLWTLPPPEVEYEIARSKETIEQKTGRAVSALAYPFSFPETHYRFRKRVTDIVARSGYTCAVSTVIGTASGSDNPFVLKRIPINSWDDPVFFGAKLRGDYDWLHAWQYASKLLRRPFPSLP